MPPAPIGPRAMTDYERQKRHRAAQRARLAEAEAIIEQQQRRIAELSEALDTATEALILMRRSRALHSSV